MSLVPDNEKELSIRIANGDESAFRIAVDKYSNRIYSVALTYLKSPTLAEDIVQEILLKLWKKREKLPELDSVDNYIFILTRNEVFSSLRKKGPSYPVGEYLESTIEETAPNPEEDLDARELQKLINEGVNLLPDRQKEAWKLTRQANLTYGEVAEQMGLSKNTVKVHLLKAMNSLRAYIREHSDDLLIFAMIMYPGLLKNH